MIPKEAIEAAAKEIEAPSEPAAQETARRALEAAAPHIRAEALLDAADDIALRGDIINKEKGGLDAWDYLIAKAKTERTTP